jgi:LCP family protein required for cell wall assembly
MRYGRGRSDPDDLGDDWGDQGGRRARRLEDQAPRRSQAHMSSGQSRRMNDSRGSGRPGKPPRRSARTGPPAPTRLGRFWRAYRHKTAFAQVGYVVAALGAVVVLVAGIGAYEIYQGLLGNVDKVNVGGLSGRSVYQQQNILVLGSQERLGQDGFGNAKTYDNATYVSNSDNLLLIHLDKTHTHAVIMSIPRDTEVYEPACRTRNKYIGYGTYPAQPQAIIDGALNIGGATCAVETVKDLTGVTLDHFVEFDFNSFREMVDAIGGVTVCVPKTGYYDPASRVHLSPGIHHVTYNQALAYVRQRHDLGGADAGGDLPRIKVQQAFISSVIQEVNSKGILTDLPKLVDIASIATKALTVDTGLGTPSALIGLAKSLAHLPSKNVALITMPTLIDPSNVDRLIPEEPEDDVLFQMISSNAGWPVWQEVARGRLPLTATHDIQVRVLNGTGVGGLAFRTEKALQALGFDVISRGDTTATANTTIEYSGTAQADAAYTLGVSLRNLPAFQNLLAEPTAQNGTPGVITLVLGSDYANFGVNAPAAKGSGGKTKGNGGVADSANQKASKSSSSPAPAGPANAVQGRSAAANICNGLPLGNN